MIELREVCRSLDVYLCSYVTSWMTHHCRVVLGGWSFLQRFTPLPSFLSLETIILTEVLWSLGALEMVLSPFLD